MEHEKLKAGIYAIINKKLNTFYIGEAEVCFLIRWIVGLRHSDAPKNLVSQYVSQKNTNRYIAMKSGDSKGSLLCNF